MNFKKIILSSLLSLIAAQSLAATKVALPEIEVVGLFKNAAVLNIDHQRKLVRVGDERHNVRLIAANSEKALVEVAGKRMLLSM
ncbi:MAG: hypothetical protein PVF28_01365, partial [Thioalkalispiraceae bacterium]